MGKDTFCYDLKFPKELNLEEGLDPRVCCAKERRRRKIIIKKKPQLLSQGTPSFFFYFIIFFVLLVEANSTCLITKQLQ
jgi:hypothetical protein